MSYMLVGEAPNPDCVGRPHTWLHPGNGTSYGNRTAGRLLRYTGYDWRTYLRVFSVRTNVWMRPKPLPIKEGRERAHGLVWDAEVARLKGIVLLGARPAAAFGMQGCVQLTWFPREGTRIALVPHPSGRCLWWNSDANRRRALDFFTELLETCTTRS